MDLNLNFTADDLKRAEDLQRYELIDPLTHENMFKGLIYVALSPREKYSTQARICSQLSFAGLDTPQAILERPNEVAYIARGLKKSIYLQELAAWWPKSNISGLILEDIANGRKDEYRIREKIVKEAKGIQYKCASLYLNMCGYHESVVADNWVLKCIVAHGYPVDPYYYIPKNGNSKNTTHNYLGIDKDGKPIYYDHGIPEKDYMRYESYFIEIAKKYGYHQFDFRQLLWIKNSSWNDRSRNDNLQFKLGIDGTVSNHDKYMLLQKNDDNSIPGWKMELMKKYDSSKEKAIACVSDATQLRLL